MSAGEAPLVWSVAEADGWLQGPLDLCYLGGRHLSLTLREGQAALLVDDDRVLAAFGPGTHGMAIDRDAGDPRRRLLFFAAGRGPALGWTAASPLRCEGDGRPALVGACDLDVVDPSLFFETFLAGGGPVDPAFVLLLVERLVRDLAASPGVEAREWLQTGVLTAALAPCGLACRRLALEAVPSAAARQEPAAPRTVAT